MLPLIPALSRRLPRARARPARARRHAGDGARRTAPRYLGKWLAAFLRETCDEPAVLVGNSLGGRTALQAALDAPDAVRGLVLLCPAVAFRRLRQLVPFVRLVRDEIVVAAGAHPARAGDARAAQPVRRSVPPAAGLVRLGDRRVRAGAGDQREPAGDVLGAAARLPGRAVRRQRVLGPAARRCKPPALFVWGDRDVLVPAGFGRFVTEALPRRAVGGARGLRSRPPVRAPRADAAADDRVHRVPLRLRAASERSVRCHSWREWNGPVSSVQVVTDVAIAAPNEAAADAGERVARAGGNAVDAALAAVLVTMVNEVGVVTAELGRLRDGAAEWRRRGVHRRRLDGHARTRRCRAAGAPGTSPRSTAAVSTSPSVLVRSRCTVRSRRWGRRSAVTAGCPGREIVAPAIDVACAGFPLSAASRFYLAYVHDDIFGWDPASRAALHDEDGRDHREPIVLPDLVRSLQLIAERGPERAAHRRAGAADQCGRHRRGGMLGMADLAAYRPVVRPALADPGGRLGAGDGATSVRRRRLPRGHAATARRPSARGLGRRRPRLARPRPARRPRASSRRPRRERGPRRGRPGVPRADRPRPRSVLESGSTAHVSAADSDGVACSVTVSSGYGSGMIAEGTGIWLNNCLGEQELNPAGLHADRLARGCCPTWHRPWAATATARPWPSGHPARTGSLPRSPRCSPATSAAGCRSRRRCATRASTFTAPGGPMSRSRSRPTSRCTSAAWVPPSSDRDGELDAVADPRRDGVVAHRARLTAEVHCHRSTCAARLSIAMAQARRTRSADRAGYHGRCTAVTGLGL